MPTIPAAYADMIDTYMRETGQSPGQSVKIVDHEPVPVSKYKRPKIEVTMVQPMCVPHGNTLTITVPIETVNESNGRDWKARSRRSGQAWKLVRKSVKLEHLAFFEARIRQAMPVYARFTRLGGRKLDPMVNLPSALKGVEDAMAFLLGVDDGSTLWIPECGQETGGLVGVRIVLSYSPLPRIM